MNEPELIDVLPAHRFDEAALARYLREHLPQMGDDLLVHQFQGGQSNPTYLLESAGRRYVLRKKPPGKVLPSAHMVEREYKVIRALAEHSSVPVPSVYLLCEDESIINCPDSFKTVWMVLNCTYSVETVWTVLTLSGQFQHCPD